MPDDTTTASGMPDLGDADALMTRLAVIEDQALEERAAAFVQLHDELRRVLEGPDASA